MTPSLERQAIRSRARWTALTLSVVVSLVAGGCSAIHKVASGEPDAPAEGASASATASIASISTSPASGATEFAPDLPVTVTVDHGRLEAVDLTGPSGVAVEGRLGPTGDVWTSIGFLELATSYTLTATAVDPDGRTVSSTSTFTTMTAPSKTFRVKVSPLDTETVGVGMPIVVYFPLAVTNRAAVESRLSVTSDPPVVGGWNWVSGTELHWRPETYWPGGADVTVSLPLSGVNAGDGTYGDQNRIVTFHITDHAIVSVVDIAAHTMTISRDGAVINTFPITSGKPGWETRDGIMVILEKWPDKEMDAATIDVPPGSPEYYDLLHVLWALRITWSGEFIHAAPWSVGSQGSRNVSHGCVGLSTDNAKILFDLTTRGDVVTIQNSPRPLEPGNGYTDWNYTWAEWLAGSALAVPTPGPTETP